MIERFKEMIAQGIPGNDAATLILAEAVSELARAVDSLGSGDAAEETNNEMRRDEDYAPHPVGFHRMNPEQAVEFERRQAEPPREPTEAEREAVRVFRATVRQPKSTDEDYAPMPPAAKVGTREQGIEFERRQAEAPTPLSEEQSELARMVRATVESKSARTDTR